MDIFGIGSAVKAAAEIYFDCARRSGRTTALIKTLKPGDRVFFGSSGMCEWFKRRLRDHGVEGVECVVWSKHCREMKRCNGRAIFDHTLVEQIYLDGIDAQAEMIKRFQDDFSGAPDAQERPIELKKFPESLIFRARGTIK